MVGMRGTLMTTVRAAAIVLADVEAAVRTIQGQIAATEALPRVARVRVWKKRYAFRCFSRSTMATRCNDISFRDVV